MLFVVKITPQNISHSRNLWEVYVIHFHTVDIEIMFCVVTLYNKVPFVNYI